MAKRCIVPKTIRVGDKLYKRSRLSGTIHKRHAMSFVGQLRAEYGHARLKKVCGKYYYYTRKG